MGLASAIVGSVAELLDKVVPDADERARLAHEISTLAERQSHEVTLAQIETNKEQAKHPSIFVAGARPATMWICNFGLLYAIIIYPILDIWMEMPALDSALLMTTLGGLLGLGTMRTVEKRSGVSRENLNG